MLKVNIKDESHLHFLLEQVVDAARPRFKKHFYESRVKTKAAASAAVIVEKVEARSDAADSFIVYLIESGDEENLFKIETDTGTSIEGIIYHEEMV